MAVFVICAYKLLPSFQQIYINLMTIKSGISSFELIEDDLLKAKKKIQNKFIGINLTEKLASNETIKKQSTIYLENVSFSYNDSSFVGLKNINLSLKLEKK